MKDTQSKEHIENINKCLMLAPLPAERGRLTSGGDPYDTTFASSLRLLFSHSPLQILHAAGHTPLAILSLCPVPCALCPCSVPCALCPVLCALCPVPRALRPEHLAVQSISLLLRFHFKRAARLARPLDLLCTCYDKYYTAENIQPLVQFYIKFLLLKRLTVY